MSEWMEFLAKFRKGSDLKGAAVMKAAGVEYRKKKGGKGKAKPADDKPKKEMKEMKEEKKGKAKK